MDCRISASAARRCSSRVLAVPRSSARRCFMSEATLSGMSIPHVNILRRALAVRGLTPASALPEGSAGRSEEACLRPARLIEDASLGYRAVGPAVPWPDPVAFLDGVQRLQLLAYAGSAPLFLGEIAAAVRERQAGRLRTVVESRRGLAIGRPAALAAAGGAVDGLTSLPLPDDQPAHPVRDLTQAGRALDRARGALELGAAYRRRSDAWLVIDGSLSESPVWAADPRALGVSKSHATLPFDGAELERYLRLPSGQRTSVFAPASRSVAPVLAWAVRLWPWEDRDLFYGLVRVEVAPVNGDTESADLL